jgi:hypothetical protein
MSNTVTDTLSLQIALPLNVTFADKFVKSCIQSSNSGLVLISQEEILGKYSNTQESSRKY